MFFKQKNIYYEKVYRTRKPIILFNFEKTKPSFEKVYEIDEAIYAKVGERIIGHIARKGQWLYSLWVDSDWRGKGIATKLVKMIEDDVPYSSVWLWASANSLKFYKSLRKWKDFGEYKVDNKKHWPKVNDHLYGKQLEKDRWWSLDDKAQHILKTVKTHNVEYLRGSLDWCDDFEDVNIEMIKKYENGYTVIKKYPIDSIAHSNKSISIEIDIDKGVNE